MLCTQNRRGRARSETGPSCVPCEISHSPQDSQQNMKHLLFSQRAEVQAHSQPTPSKPQKPSDTSEGSASSMEELSGSQVVAVMQCKQIQATLLSGSGLDLCEREKEAQCVNQMGSSRASFLQIPTKKLMNYETFVLTKYVYIFFFFYR